MRSLVASGVTLFLILTGCSKFNESSREGIVSGTIESDETRVASRYGGRVEHVLAHEGESLKPGELIVQISAPELLPRREQAQAVLAELREGPRQEEIAAAKADAESLVAQLDFARADLKRITELYEEKTVPKAELDRAASQANALEKSVAAAKSRHDLLLAGTRPERIAQAEAQLREIETQIAEMGITAPTNSILEVLHVKVGDVVSPNQPVATLLLTNHLWVRVYVPEPWLGHIRLGDKVPVQVDSFPGREFQGEVEQIARAAEFTPRNVQTVSDRIRQVFGVKVRLPSEGGELRGGMAADVFFPRVPTEMR